MNANEVKAKLKVALDHLSTDLAEGRTLTVKVVDSAVFVEVDPPVSFEATSSTKEST